MLAPSGYVDTLVNPDVQATTRPAGTLLQPSPGFDTIRRGKNRFQGRGPSGGFRQMEYAEDVGGTGAALAVTPGDTASVEASEWLPEEGEFLISDRGEVQEPGSATALHEAYNTVPDMGDRHPDRPLSKSRWLYNPMGVLREDYRRSPAMTVVGVGALLALLNVVLRDLEREYGRARGRGVTGAVAAAPTAAVSTGGDVAESSVKEISDTAEEAARKIQQVTEESVGAIKSAADDAVNSVKNASTGE